MVKRLILNAIKSSLFLLVFITFDTDANIEVTPKELQVKSGVYEIKIYNSGVSDEYLKIDMYFISNPGVEVNDEILIRLGDLPNPSLYAFPFKMVIGPQQEKSVIIKILKIENTERVYRLFIRPQVLINKSQVQRSLLKLNVSYGLLIRQTPLDLKREWSYECLPTGTLIKSFGNFHNEFDTFTHDDEVYSFNLYPGQEKLFTKKIVTGFVNGHKLKVDCNR